MLNNAYKLEWIGQFELKKPCTACRPFIPLAFGSQPC